MKKITLSETMCLAFITTTQIKLCKQFNLNGVCERSYDILYDQVAHSLVPIYLNNKLIS